MDKFKKLIRKYKKIIVSVEMTLIVLAFLVGANVLIMGIIILPLVALLIYIPESAFDYDEDNEVNK